MSDPKTPSPAQNSRGSAPANPSGRKATALKRYLAFMSEGQEDFISRETLLEVASYAAALQARIQGLEEVIRWAHDTLYEITPSNYDHDEVCKINGAPLSR